LKTIRATIRRGGRGFRRDPLALQQRAPLTAGRPNFKLAADSGCSSHGWYQVVPLLSGPGQSRWPPVRQCGCGHRDCHGAPGAPADQPERSSVPVVSINGVEGGRPNPGSGSGVCGGAIGRPRPPARAIAGPGPALRLARTRARSARPGPGRIDGLRLSRAAFSSWQVWAAGPITASAGSKPRALRRGGEGGAGGPGAGARVEDGESDTSTVTVLVSDLARLKLGG
jgi:hypothetical protein